MINPKALTGPTASNVFPTIKGVPGRKTISDEERQEASILTHSMWMANPPGVKNCHFLTTIEDDVGPNGILIDPNKPFETESQYQYLDAQLESIEDHEIIERIHIAHRQLPKLFRQINMDTRIIYPFKYDSTTGIFIYEDLEKHLLKNIQQGNV
jgi:hypothetical protein